MKLPISRATRLKIIHVFFIVFVLAIIAEIAIIAAGVRDHLTLAVLIDFDEAMVAVGWLVILPLIVVTFFWPGDKEAP